MAKPVLKVDGLQETYVVLRSMQPEMVKQTIKRMKTEARPIVSLLRKQIPLVALSGWRAPRQTDTLDARGVSRGSVSRFPRYDGKAVRRRTNLSVKNYRSRESGKRSLFVSFTSRDPASRALDMGGKNTTTLFSENMTAKYRAPSRIMWPTVESRLSDITIIVTRAKTDMEREITEQLNRQGYGSKSSRMLAAKAMRRGAGALR